MTRIWPRSLRDVRHAAPTAALGALLARSRRRGALLLLVLSTAGCTFDTTPTTRARDAGSSAATWLPPSIGRQNRITSQQTRAANSDAQADAESSSDSMTSDTPATHGRNADAGRKIVDTGQPAQSTKRDAGSGIPGSASSMGTPDAKDGSVSAAPKPDTSQCMPGIYEGVFEGPVTFAVGSINSVSGIVRAELVLEPPGESLRISDGVMTGKDSTGVGMSATWTGSLNCRTKQLENGRHETGAWENGSTFTGTLAGSYSVNPYSVSGTWQVQSEQIPLAGGNGTWRMSLRGSATP